MSLFNNIKAVISSAYMYLVISKHLKPNLQLQQKKSTNLDDINLLKRCSQIRHINVPCFRDWFFACIICLKTQSKSVWQIPKWCQADTHTVNRNHKDADCWDDLIKRRKAIRLSDELRLHKGTRGSDPQEALRQTSWWGRTRCRVGYG